MLLDHSIFLNSLKLASSPVKYDYDDRDIVMPLNLCFLPPGSKVFLSLIDSIF